jgi:hypothetical protein
MFAQVNAVQVWWSGAGSNRRPSAFQEDAPSTRSLSLQDLRVERLVPLRAQHPRQSRHPPADQPPFEVVPAQVLTTVLLLDPSSGLAGPLQNLALPFLQRLFTRLDLL